MHAHCVLGYTSQSAIAHTHTYFTGVYLKSNPATFLDRSEQQNSKGAAVSVCTTRFDNMHAPVWLSYADGCVLPHRVLLNIGMPTPATTLVAQFAFSRAGSMHRNGFMHTMESALSLCLDTNRCHWSYMQCIAGICSKSHTSQQDAQVHDVVKTCSWFMCCLCWCLELCMCVSVALIRFHCQRKLVTGCLLLSATLGRVRCHRTTCSRDYRCQPFSCERPILARCIRRVDDMGNAYCCRCCSTQALRI